MIYVRQDKVYLCGVRLVNLASKCEQLPEQLDYDDYYTPWNVFNENINYNDGYLYLDMTYKGSIDFLCDEIHEKNVASKNLLDDIMDECSDLIDFSEEREWNERVFRKINCIQNLRKAFDEFTMEVEKLDEEMAESMDFAKGYVQSVPKMTGEMVEGIINLPSAIQELPGNIQSLWKLVEEYGVKEVACGILDSTEENIKRVWNEEVVTGTARSRGEITG